MHKQRKQMTLCVCFRERFVSGKAKVVPKNNCTAVPRLELTAALMAAIMHCNIHQCLTLPINRRYLWRDSQTTLNWIGNTNQRFDKFIHRKVNKILISLAPMNGSM